MPESPPICDYEGSDYRARFWEGQRRNYEDKVERIALRRLMPPVGNTLIEIGAGYGRLASEYSGYRKVVLFDYSRSLLRDAQSQLGDDPRYIYAAGNWYNMPFVPALFDTIVQVRTLHHAADVPSLLQQLARIARPGGTYVLEFANKMNLKAILRYWSGRQEWSPFSLEPVEFVELNFDFHPNWIRQQLQKVNFAPERMLAVSYFRFEPLKRLIPTGILVSLDRVLQHTGNWWQLSPSIFVSNGHPLNGDPAAPDAFFACPYCQTPLGQTQKDRLRCTNPQCGHHWQIDDGLYDFKDPVSAG
jgi:ubiquinone/menaquinone biosynthesis C-methylase UbiE